MRTLLLVCCLGASIAQAQPERIAEARQAFEEGAAAFSGGEFARALDRFTRAYELAPRSELLYNIATAHDRLGHADDALRYYRDYLEATPEADNRDYTESRIGVLEEQIAQAAQEPDEPDPVHVVVQPVESERSANIGAITLIAAGGASAIAAAITGGLALSQRGDLDDACPMGDCSPDRRDDLNRLDRLTISTDVLIGIAAATAITGVIWLIVGGGDDDEDVALDPSGVRVRF